MTKKAQEAYIRGFCKVAEAYGVDPEQLMKVANKVKATAEATSRFGPRLERILLGVQQHPRRVIPPADRDFLSLVSQSLENSLSLRQLPRVRHEHLKETVQRFPTVSNNPLEAIALTSGLDNRTVARLDKSMELRNALSNLTSGRVPKKPKRTVARLQTIGLGRPTTLRSYPKVREDMAGMARRMQKGTLKPREIAYLNNRPKTPLEAAQMILNETNYHIPHYPPWNKGAPYLPFEHDPKALAEAVHRWTNT